MKEKLQSFRSTLQKIEDSISASQKKLNPLIEQMNDKGKNASAFVSSLTEIKNELVKNLRLLVPIEKELQSIQQQVHSGEDKKLFDEVKEKSQRISTTLIKQNQTLNEMMKNQTNLPVSFHQTSKGQPSLTGDNSVNSYKSVCK